jgi:hypothetical protein
MARQRQPRAYVEVLERIENELESLMVEGGSREIDQDDPFITPWRRKHDAAIRTVLAN